MAKTLIQRNKDWAKSFSSNGHVGLGLMIETVEHMAQHRDWDAAAHMLQATEALDNVHSCFKRIIRVGLGDVVTLNTRAKDHATGYRFKFKAKGTDSIPLRNIFATVKDYFDKGHAFNSIELQTKLKELLGEEKAAKAFDADAYAKRVFKKLREEGTWPSMISAKLAKLEAEAKAKDAETPPVTTPNKEEEGVRDENPVLETIARKAA